MYLQSWTKFCNIHIFLSFLPAVHPCEIFLQFSLPPPYTKLKLGKNSAYTRPTLFVGWGEGLDLCELETPQKRKTVPRLLSMIVVRVLYSVRSPWSAICSPCFILFEVPLSVSLVYRPISTFCRYRKSPDWKHFSSITSHYEGTISCVWIKLKREIHVWKLDHANAHYPYTSITVHGRSTPKDDCERWSVNSIQKKM